MNDKEFSSRLAQRLQEERTDPAGWWYLSFAAEVFLGGVIVYAHGLVDARMQLPALGIQSPGGQVFGARLPDDLLPTAEYRNRLLNKTDVLAIWARRQDRRRV